MKIDTLFRHLRTALRSDDRKTVSKLLIGRLDSRFDRTTDRSAIIAHFSLLLDDAAQLGMAGRRSILTYILTEWNELTETERKPLRSSLMRLAERTDDTTEFLMIVELLAGPTCTVEEVAAVAALAAGRDETRRYMVAHALGHALRDADDPAARELARAKLLVLADDPSEATRGEVQAVLGRESPSA